MRSQAIVSVALATFQLCSGFTTSPSRVGFQTSLAATAATYSPAELQAKFSTLKKAFPADVDPVAAGGWYNLQKLSGNPKEDLVNMVVDGLKNKQSKTQFAVDGEKVEALTTLLYGMGKGFEADLVDGDWALVFSKQGKKSPKFQKLVGKGEKAGLSLNVFDTKSMTFSGDVTLLKKCKVDSKVKYAPQSTAFSKTSDGKMVLRRIGCDIIGAGFKVWKLPRLPLPLRKKGGYLEFVYMDKDIRVTKGNRGGLFVHFRPEFLEQQLAK